MRKFVLIGGGVLGLAVIAVVALVVIQLLRSDDPNLKTEAPQIPTQTTSAGSTPAASTGAAASPTAAVSATLPAGVLRFVIDQSGSEVKYVVREKLSRLPVSSDAVGTTNAITGDLYLSAQGLASGQKSSLSVDLTKLRSDESQRDNFVRSNVLQTNRFPTATFTAESITGFPANYVEGQEASMTVKGTLTIHGVSKQVEWAVKVRYSGGTMTGIADIDFNMTDYGITPPEVPVAKAENGVHLQITILAKQG